METTTVERLELARFIQEHQQNILSQWLSERREDRKSRQLTREQLLDHLPRLLEGIAEALASDRSVDDVPDADPSQHALTRLDQGFDLDQVVEEYAILRQVLFRTIRQHDRELVVDGFELLEQSIDRSITRSVTRFADIRHRTLIALDRISQTSLGTDDIESLLPQLLTVLMETTPSVDSVAILLAEGEWLRTRAAVGLVEERDSGFRLRIGEGFAGTIAATKKPLFLRSAATDPLVRSDFIKKRGVRALYGVPLLRGDHVMGVAHMGSVTAHEFADEDLLVFRAAAERAALLLVQAEQRAALKEAAEFRDRIIAITSHDLRSPLQAVKLTAHLILTRGNVPEGILKAMQRIASATLRMESIVSGLLDYTQSRFRGPLHVEIAPADLAEIARKGVDEIQIAYPSRAIQLDVQGDTRGEWDGQRMAQVISNLVSNAIQHGADGTPVRVSVQGGSDEVTIEVENEGRPIAPDFLPHIFEPFRRGQSDGVAQDRGGFGLGLYIVQQIVLAHGGKVDVQSDAKSTVFSVRLPRAARASAPS